MASEYKASREAINQCWHIVRMGELRVQKARELRLLQAGAHISQIEPWNDKTDEYWQARFRIRALCCLYLSSGFTSTKAFSYAMQGVRWWELPKQDKEAA